MKRFSALISVLCLFALVMAAAPAWSEQPPTPVPAATATAPAVAAPQISEVTKLRLLNSYKTALMAQATAAQAQQALQQAVDAYNAATKRALVQENLPEGTTLIPDLAKDDVTAKPPAKQAEAKPAEDKKAK